MAYAFETVIPALDLGSKKHCDFTPDNHGWYIFRMVVTLLGWIFTSLNVLSWTGLFRRNAEP